ncbi:hypothetical protein PUR29_36320 [Methylobacterium ajmalii]|uniref:Uncharacterized protein n=1 Tax=Methylobacterium ajmalii TaxID=2738439 RepID=A0ABV0A503_9HYPH
MHPRQFFEEVVTPNIHAVEAQADDMRAVVNAVLTLDALVGLLHAHLDALGRPEVAGIEDDEYRERLGEQCPGYAALRDAAATLKHGRLTRPRRKRPPRLIKTLDRIQSTELVLGEFGIGDEIGGGAAVLCLENGGDAVRVDDAIAETCRVLLPLLDSLPERAGSAPA